jgi:predicted PurR-regulated permease PerM
MPLALALTGLLFSGLLVLTIDNASAFASKLMSYGPRLSALVAELAEAAPIAAAPSLDEILPRLDPGGYLVSAAGVVQSMAADTLLILVYLGFILASRRSLERKVLNLSDIREERRAVAAAYRAIIEAHRGLTESESAELNAALVLILANQLGDMAMLHEALVLAQRSIKGLRDPHA